MKNNIFAGILLFFSSFLYAQITGFPFEPGNVDINITKSKNLNQIENNSTEEEFLAYKNRQETYEIRLLQYRLVNTSLSNEDINRAFMPYMFMVINNLVGDENAIKRIIPYDSNGVKAENGGDTGFAVFIQYESEAESGFYSGYEYAIMNVFLKFNKGIVIKTIMFNDISVMDNRNFNTDFSIFRYRN